MAVPKTTTSAAATGVVIVTATPNPSKQEENDQNPNPILSFFTNFLKNFRLPPLPFLPFQKHKVSDEPATSDAVQSAYGVSYPRRGLTSEKLEADVVQVRETQPLVVWQAYAIGGILVLRWAWVRWNERRSRKPPNDDTPPPPPPSSVD